MEYTCPTCGAVFPRELLKIISHTEEHIVEEVKKRHPEWADKDGICKRCYEHYKDQLRHK